jgi:hypothetical protein
LKILNDFIEDEEDRFCPVGVGGTAKQIAIAAMAIALQLQQIADPLGPLQCNMPLIALAQGT